VPCALCPVPCALCPVPCALCPVPCALCPVPCALCPVPCALLAQLTCQDVCCCRCQGNKAKAGSGRQHQRLRSSQQLIQERPHHLGRQTDISTHLGGRGVTDITTSYALSGATYHQTRIAQGTEAAAAPTSLLMHVSRELMKSFKPLLDHRVASSREQQGGPTSREGPRPTCLMASDSYSLGSSRACSTPAAAAAT
jgi:hypothetical protein